jgi:hypothetical protein
MKKRRMTFRILEALTGLYECRCYEDWTGDYYSAEEVEPLIEENIRLKKIINERIEVML